jgi:hypothetical protein
VSIRVPVCNHGSGPSSFPMSPRALRTPSSVREELPPGFITREHRMNNDSEQQRIVHLALSSALGEYLERVRELGAVEGLDGAVELNPTLKPVLEAMHHVLAGGEVEVRIVRDGQPDIFHELQQRAVQATEETNAINQPPGRVLVTAV